MGKTSLALSDKKSIPEATAMRKLAFVVLPLCCLLALQAPAQSKKSKMPYQVEFDAAKDVTQMDRSPDGKEGIYIKVRFAITLDGAKVEKFGDDHKLVIEENGQRVKEVDVPRPVASEELSVMLAIDTSGSMNEHGRMEQARVAAAAFLQKLPARSDCGLILFDHEIRDRMPPIFERPPLLTKINTVKPRGGTAYLDAASEGITVLRNTVRGRDRAVVLMTDGIDLNSKKNIQQVIAEAKKDHVRVYTIGIGEPGKLDRVNTVLVLDHSGSMKPPASDTDTTSKIVALHLAAERYVDSMSTVGRASIIPFSTIVGMPRPFLDKSQAFALKKTIKSLQPYGETALFDATYEAISVLEADASRGKRAVIAMTDGYDNTSRRRVEEVIERAKDAKIPLYMLAFGRDGEIDDVIMRQMAESTGGKFYHAKNKDSLIEIFENLSIQLHDDGIDEISLKKIAQETGGAYYAVKDISELRLILDKVNTAIQHKSYEVTFPSLLQKRDGTRREIAIKLVRRSGELVSNTATGVIGEQVIQSKQSAYQTRGLVVAEMHPLVYLTLLAGMGLLLLLPVLAKMFPGAG